MSSALARRQGHDLVPINRQTEKDVLAVYRRGVVQAARIEAATYVTHVGQQAVGFIAATESVLIQQVPLAEPRLKLIGDTHAGTVASVIGRLGL